MQTLLLPLSILVLSATALAGGDPPEFLLEWGSFGPGAGELSGPHGVVVADDGSVYIADTGNARIQKFTGDGVFITQWGSFGSGPGQFNHPHGIGIGPGGDVYVAETGNNRVQRFTGDGVFVTMWGSFGTGDGQFQHNHGLAVNSNGDVFVADRDQDRVQKFASDGTFLFAFGATGTGDGQFTGTNGVAIDAADNVFVADSSPRIQKFTSDGVFITSWGSLGTGDGQFDFPRQLSTDAAGNVYVSDRDLNRMQMFTGDGTFVTKWGSIGNAPGEFMRPYAIRAGAGGLVYVADTSNHRVQMFRLDTIQSFCSGDGGDRLGCTNCPCGNQVPGTTGGCTNSSGTNAELAGSGLPEAANDSLRFEVRGANPSTFGLLFSGQNRLPDSAANPCFGLDSGIANRGDGLRCMGGAALRHGTRASDANGDIGMTTPGWGPPDGPPAGIAAQSSFTLGQTRHFQVFYREDPAASPCAPSGSDTNTTNGVSVTFL